MRRKKGNLIAVWVPGNHGAGGSTIANSTAIAMNHITGCKTLLMNWGSTRNCMEQYMKNDVKFGFSMDHLRSFKGALQAEHIKAFATVLNEGLSILPNSKLSISGLNKTEFEVLFLEQALGAYNLVVADIETGMSERNQSLLEQADLILAVMNCNAIALEEICYENNAIRSWIQAQKTIPVFNGIQAAGEKKLLQELNSRFELAGSFGVTYDVKANRAACFEGKFYSYFKAALIKGKKDECLAAQVEELCRIISEKLYEETNVVQTQDNPFSLLCQRVKHWGELDV